MAYNDDEINMKAKEEAVFFEKVKNEVGKVIVGQDYMIDRIIIGLLTREHLLLEGVPGLAKTLCIKTISDVMHLKFSRIQFTPDLLPADLIGTVIYNQKSGEFSARKGPIFGNIVLADEINRSPAKVQSALLQAMQERQVTLGDETYQLKPPFLVLATQNPIELEGTYSLPEAQLDRFMFKINITYPSVAEEKEIMRRMSRDRDIKVDRIIAPEEIQKAGAVINEININESIEDYIIKIVFATRNPVDCGIPELKDMIEYGVSPRASIFLNKAARAHAFLHGRGYVIPDDVKAIAHDVLRHRLILTYEAESDGLTADSVLNKILSKIDVP
ncbi:MAG: MoxR family ATPase [Nitrospinae bacterium]|nr:MoxR family ATPase [Nitrospinota bacterium]MBI3814992.1 MoxR family ATPase [Nitrospinota bacterium]